MIPTYQALAKEAVSIYERFKTTTTTTTTKNEHQQQLFIAIAGGPGSGKSTVAHKVCELVMI